ncbi:hypothetical protein ASG48_15705 [Aurantimonas sp. Leaf443]|nr:hypothetical protein ASG48_15705 [Aurantimonas sp. Leaf443]
MTLNEKTALKPELCRGARGLLDWTQSDLAETAGVSRSTIRDFECGRHELHRATEAAVLSALTTAGIRFVDCGEDGPGLSLHRPTAKHESPNEA